MLSLTIVSNSFSSGNSVAALPTTVRSAEPDEFVDFDFHADFENAYLGGTGGPRERETIITQDVPVKVLPMQAVEGLHEPRIREPDVHICLPNLQQVKSISERFTRLELATKSSTTVPRLDLSANMHGSLKIAISTDALSISSVWTGLANPELDPANMENGSQGIRDHPSTRMKMLGGEHGENEAGWARVRIDGKDWQRVLSVGRLGGRTIACEVEFALELPIPYLPLS